MSSATAMTDLRAPAELKSGFPPLLLALFFLSGATGLVYELVWTRELMLVFGGTTYAITTTLVAFMGGLGLGSYVAGRLSHFVRQPGFVYGALELAIGLYAIATPFLLAAAEPVYRALYPSVDDYPLLLTAARFLISGAILLLPTFMMGATMPLLARFITLQGGRLGLSTGVLYGVNSGGAVLGVLITGFILIPTLGVKAATFVTAAANVLIGLVAMAGLRVDPGPPQIGRGRGSAEAAPTPEPENAGDIRRAVLLSYGLSGFAAMVYQIMWTRALVLSLGSSTYSFTCILAAFIMGLSLGSLAMARFADRVRSPGAMIGLLQLLIGASAVVMLPIYGFAPVVMFNTTAWLAGDPDALISVRFLFVIAVTLAPTLLMGAQFPLIARTLARASNDAAAATGRAYAANTLGAITGSFLGGFVLIALIGTQHSITLAAVLNALAGVWLMRVTREPGPQFERRSNIAALAALAVPVIALASGRWDGLLMSGGGFHHDDDPRERAARYDLLYYGEGVDLTVAVCRAKDDPTFLTLTVNAKPDASTARTDMVTQLLTGHLPVLLGPDRDVKTLVIGLGSGITVSSLARYPNVKSIECAEISEEVVLGAKFFGPYNHAVLTDDRRVTIKHADGRNHLLLSDQVYDIIVSEPSNPWIAGVATLFTKEFYELVRSRMTEDGIFLGWTHGYSTSVENFQLVLRTLMSVFEHVSVWELADNDYGLICSRQPLAAPVGRVLERFMQPQVREDLYRIGGSHLEKILGRYLGNQESLRAWIGAGALHSDVDTRLEFTGPRYLYENRGQEILEALLRCRRSPVGDVLSVAPDDVLGNQLRDRIARVAEGRALRLAGFDMEFVAREPIRMTQTLLQAYRLDSGNVGIYELIKEARVGFRQHLPHLLETEEGRKLMEAIDGLRVPVWAPLAGASLPEIALRLRQVAGDAVRLKHWQAAFEYLSEAYDIDPRNPALNVEMAWVLASAGAKDEAFRGLEQGLHKGVLSPEYLQAAEPLSILRDDPRFAALLSTAATQSAPVSAPAPP